MEEIAQKAHPEWKPDIRDLRKYSSMLVLTPYGMTNWRDLFTPRQLVALTTFSDLVQEARERVKRDALAAGCLGRAIRRLEPEAVGAARKYADAIAVYLAIMTGKVIVFLQYFGTWRTGEDKSAPAFGRQAIPMVWDFAEANPFAGAGGDFGGVR